MTNAVALIPATGDMSQWTPQEQALMEFAGLTWVEGSDDARKRYYAPRAVVEAFAAAVKRTNLDPVAKQIYAVQMGGKWSIIVGVDGMRVVAQRTGQYEGATPIQWTADGVTWLDVWLDTKTPPAAARIGIRRAGFAEPLVSVVTWAEFGKTTGQWKNMPAHMLAIRCETHALRRAFPNDLSGLYTIEDLDGGITPDAIEPSEDWFALIRATTDKKDLSELTNRIRGLDENGQQVGDNEMTGDLRATILAHAGTLTIDSRPAAEQPTAAEKAAKAVGTALDPADTNYVEPEGNQ